MSKTAPDLASGIAAADLGPDGVLNLEPGIYDLTPEYLTESFRFVSNNDAGLKRIFCDLSDCSGAIIDGNGSTLRCHGRLIPFYLTGCRNLTLRNFRIDWKRPLMSQATILAVRDDGIDCEFPADQPVTVKHGRLFFHGDHYESDHLHNALEFSAVRRETEYKVYDHYDSFKDYRAEALGDRRFRLYFRSRRSPRPGNLMVFKHEPRLCPAIVLDRCENIRLENLTIHHCGGMGVVAQMSRNLTLERVDVVPDEASGRVFSAHADASHFVDCDGDIFIRNCRFCNQMDDPVNIHGIFRPVRRTVDPRTLGIGLVHPQQVGIDTIRPGDRVGFYDRNTCELRHTATAVAVRRINSTYSEMTLTELPPDIVWTDTAAMKLCRDVNVEISGCHFANNRARGVLISTPGRVLIRDNYFHTPGAAIRISGDIQDWYESGPVDDVEICGNTFDNCNFGVWGEALFDLVPQLSPEFRTRPVHANIRIHHNRIRYFHKPVLTCRCVENLEFYDNELTESTDYPLSNPDRELFDRGPAVSTGRMTLPAAEKARSV